MDREAIKEQLVNAFSDVELGTGIGLWQAQAIDDRESNQVQKEIRLNDEKNNWKSFSSEELQRCSSSLSFFDSDGMRFHLPAFILEEIEGGIDAGIVFHLTQLDDYGLSKFTSLNKMQKSSILKFLKWCLSKGEYHYDHQSIRRAIDKYWKKI